MANPAEFIPGSYLDIEEDFKDVYELSDPDGHILRTARLQAVFSAAGFLVKTIERAPTHPVWIIKLANQVPLLPEGQPLADYVLGLLRSIDIPCLKADLQIQQLGRRIQVSFLLVPAPKRVRKRKLQRLLAELP